jgi:putative endonuclease
MLFKERGKSAGMTGLMGIQVRVLRWMSARARRRVLRSGSGAVHLNTGITGEREALLHLREVGYTVVARRWRSAKLYGDIDLVGWEGEWLCFVEVKTRVGRDAMEPAEAEVDEDKRRMMRKMARAYLRGFPKELRGKVPVRFDVVSVYLQPAGTEFELYRGAYGWQ